ncbi:MAG TPA: ZIP family metal transporter [Firmicutes bacterium]|uniref:ZIP family metal transporter n=1 Tax=Capillibacterium thermochitinicola TaxID=2699427 RepID=A0A8J6I064_9FIRM|nr:ZIP family metal transporter [Capillibacterium thermochitinicola]MBA2133185.1 ZIP family metal transporter [Capillibacterium thermochitinicola]HHW12077.1 ZIP family metal transporter [Bacillota bacterium]
MGLVLFAAFLGFLVGVSGAGLGGVVAGLCPTVTRRQQSLLMGSSGGIMLGVVIWDLFPEAWSLSPVHTITGTIAGALFLLILRQLDQETTAPTAEARFTKTGRLLGFGIALHNFPEGLAVGTVFVHEPFSALWWRLSLLMALHNIPEGIAVATTLRLGKTKWWPIVRTLFWAEVPMAVGALLGGLLGQIATPWSATALGFAGGAMLTLVLVEMIPLATRLAGWPSALTGLALGAAGARLLILFLASRV